MVSPPNTLLVDGHDLRADFPGLRVVGDMMLYAPGTRRGNDITRPGLTGQVGVAGLPRDAYAFTVSVWVAGSTRGAKEANLLTTATQLLGTAGDGLVTLKRRLALSDDSGYFESTAKGRFVAGLAFALFNSETGHTELQFINLDGVWRKTSDNSVMPL